MMKAQADAPLSAPVSAAMPTEPNACGMGCAQGQIPWQSGEGAMRATLAVAGQQSAKRGTSTRHHHKAPSTSGRKLTQLMGQCRGRTHVPMPHMTPAARPCAGTAANRLSKPTMRLTHERVPGSTNAPPMARSRTARCFPCSGLAYDYLHVGKSRGHLFSHQKHIRG